MRELVGPRRLCNFEAILVDLERPDPGFQSGPRHPEPGCRAQRAIDPSPALAQGGLNDFSLLRRTLPQEVELFTRSSDHWLSRDPTLIDRESPRLTDNDGTFDNILQFANIPRPGVRLKQIEALPADRLKALSGFSSITIQEVLDQQGYVFLSLSK